MIQNQRYKYIHQQNKVKVLSNEGNKSKYLDLVITKKKVENPKVYTTKYSIPLKNAPSPASYLRSSMPLSTKDTLSLKPNKKEYKNKITVTKEDKSLKESKDLRDNRKKYMDKNIKENKPIYNTRNKTKEEEKPLISDGNILKNSYDFNRMNRDKAEQSELRHSSCTRMNRGKETQLENLNINDDYLQKKLRDRNNARRNFLSPGVIHIPLKAEKLIRKENDKIKMIKEESEKVENPSNKEPNENKNITVNTSNISNSISTKYYRKKDSNRNRKDKEFINKVNEKDKSKGKIKDISKDKIIIDNKENEKEKETLSKDKLRDKKWKSNKEVLKYNDLEKDKDLLRETVKEEKPNKEISKKVSKDLKNNKSFEEKKEIAKKDSKIKSSKDLSKDSIKKKEIEEEVIPENKNHLSNSTVNNYNTKNSVIFYKKVKITPLSLHRKDKSFDAQKDQEKIQVKTPCNRSPHSNFISPMVESNTDNKLRGSHMLSKSTNSNTNELALSYISNQENKFKVLSPVRPKARTIIKLEDLLILEERLNILLTGIFNLDENIIGGVSGQCYEWLTFYYNSSLVDSLQYYGENQTEQILLKTENNLEIFAIIIAYELSYFHTLVKAFKGILKNAFMKIKRNYLLIVKILFYNIEYTEEEEMFYLKFVNIMKRNGIEQEVPIDNIYFEMKRNCSEIVLHLKSIISEYKNNKIPITNDLIYAFNNLSRFNNVMLDKLLHERIIPYLKGGDQEILNQANFNQSNSAYLDVNNSSNITNNIKGIKNPYIKTPSRKKYTLILDLDETLICCKYKLNALDQKLLSLRPWLIKFLKSVREYYEIISFTCGKKDYAMPILDLIENGEKLFDHKLYREHSSILDHDYIKDISLIGRELNKMIIVDNNLMSFRKQKENGILICPFYAQDSNDKVLLELESILIRMAKENEEDIRKTLLKYKEEIILKVSRSA